MNIGYFHGVGRHYVLEWGFRSTFNWDLWNMRSDKAKFYYKKVTELTLKLNFDWEKRTFTQTVPNSKNFYQY